MHTNLENRELTLRNAINSSALKSTLNVVRIYDVVLCVTYFVNLHIIKRKRERNDRNVSKRHISHTLAVGHVVSGTQTYAQKHRHYPWNEDKRIKRNTESFHSCYAKINHTRFLIYVNVYFRILRKIQLQWNTCWPHWWRVCTYVCESMVVDRFDFGKYWT